jgi:cellulose synthase/poly-beta-1,6-N-acetylglucosamine synthase-like glycosyltransferase
LAKDIVSSKWNHGDNYLRVDGKVLLSRTSVLKTIEFPETSGVDLFLYIQIKERGGDFIYIKDSYINYLMPETFIDHLKQSTRYLSTPKSIYNYIPIKVLNKYRRLPLKIKLLILIKMILINPLYTLLYLLILLFSRIYSLLFIPVNSSLWSISTTTKK